MNSRGVIVVPHNIIDPCTREIIDTLHEITKLPVIAYEDFIARSMIANSIVIAIAIPTDEIGGQKLLNLRDDVRLICWVNEFGWTNAGRQLQIDRVFNKSLMIITPHVNRLNTIWKLYIHKTECIPLHAAACFLDVKYTEAPELKCSLNGPANYKYPIRRQIDITLDGMSYINHDGIIGRQLAQKISTYYCAIADGGNVLAQCHDLKEQLIQIELRMHRTILFTVKRVQTARDSCQIVKEYFEIPAAGSLLLADDRGPKEWESLGLRHMENCVAITENNVINIVGDVLTDPVKYEPIRKAGYKFIRDHHTIANRVSMYVNTWNKFLKLYPD